jgi:hypothetical protein
MKLSLVSSTTMGRMMKALKLLRKPAATAAKFTRWLVACASSAPLQLHTAHEIARYK